MNKETMFIAIGCSWIGFFIGVLYMLIKMKTSHKINCQ